ncbi:ArsR/SmtB family transcription factor [Arcanobacterium hippocoleae]|uniref:ArsR family transcriptional regulator n=1 Tax=Arcanobacterium hippocoleae TaxID=149017 RepID=A0ABU1SZQ1_9ACTO|nr:metalloregulator ArsR/SmtB family transcription factor [Arcanobacterium hippocoleae]MDR6938588.1 ArsR family transcriptional regulator [Arcanobacterium hippocoleae]
MSYEIFAEDDGVIRLFSSLANPIRATIIWRLTEGSADVSELTEILQVSQPLVSGHLAILRKAHLIEAKRVGRRMEYSLIDEHVAHIFKDAYTHMKEHDHCEH